MAACETCWDEAFRRSHARGGHQAEHYEAILLLPPSERTWCAFASGLTDAAEPDPWCRREDCQHRHWRSGSMPTHRRGDDCPKEKNA